MGLNLKPILDVAKSIVRIGKIVLPFLRPLRDLLPEFDRVADEIDEQIDKAGEVADDFFDRNLAKLGELREFFLDLGAVSEKGVAAIDEIIVASQVETPEKITPEEAERIGRAVNELRAAIAAAATRSEGLEERIAAMV